MSTIPLVDGVGPVVKILYAIDGLVIKDQQNGPYVICFCGVGPKKRYMEKGQEH
jgi:hypothetical protein